MFAAGVPVLPPVDVVPSARVTTPRDLLDALFWQKILEVITLGLVFFLHCGTPCNTFTAARKLDGGPPPLRSADAPLGLPNLSEADRMLVFLGNLIFGAHGGGLLPGFHFGRRLHDREPSAQFVMGNRAPSSARAPNWHSLWIVISALLVHPG